MQWLRNTYIAVVSRLLWNRTFSRLNIHECSGGATCLQVLIKQMSDTSHSFVKRRCFAKDEENIRNLCYKTETLKDQRVNNIFASMVSHVHGHIHSTVALLWFDCLRNRPRWIRQCNPETFPRSSVIPEVFPKMHRLLSVVSRRSPHNYLKVPLYLSGGESLYLHTSKRQKLRLSALFVQPSLCCWGKKKKKNNKTRRWPGEMKDEPLWQSNCAVESISNLINIAPQPLQCSDPALICSVMRCGTAVKGIAF